MKTNDLTIPASDLFGRITVNVRVTGMAIASARIRLAIWLFWLAARVGGVGIEIDVDEAR